MSSSPPDDQRFKHRLELWTAVLVIVGSYTALVARVVGTEDVQHGHTERIAEHSVALARQEDRLRAVETSRSADAQIAALTAKIAALEATVQLLREDIRRRSK